MRMIRQLHKIVRPCLVLLYFILNTTCQAEIMPSSWDVVKHQFKLQHHVNNPRVQQQIRWLISHPNYLNQLKDAEPFIYHIITEIQKKHLPGELALIPMIESSYNPFAYSSAGASGLWQLMPATGKDYGIKKDWWIDERRSIHSSTNAALKYFKNLERYFDGDWLLAIAAYDCGEGTIRRALKSSPTSMQSFWSLSLPDETLNYVPRLLALAEIIEHPDKYHIQLPYVQHQPYFAEVFVRKQIDLNQFAKLAGLNFKEFIQLNPGFNHLITSPNKLTKLLIPKHKLTQFHQTFRHIPQPKSTFFQYTVQNGDTLASVSQKFHTNIFLLAHMNQLKSSHLEYGQSLNIPINPQNPTNHRFASNLPPKPQPITPQFYKMIHIVQEHEDIAFLEKKYHISAYQIMAWNQMSNDNISPGQMLVIWRTS